MPLWKIALRSIQQRALASSLTGLSMALGVALVVAVLVMHGVISKSFMTGSGLGYNVIVGANKGGKLQLVLNTVYYLSSPVENIPYSLYKEFTTGEYKAYVEKAVPVCLGDYFEEFRVIGTTPAFFNDLDFDNGQKFTFSSGRNYKEDEFFSGVIGSTVAAQTGLKVGSEFHPSHGAGPEAHKHDPFKVVGILAPTGTPNDRALFVNIEGFYLLDNHALPGESKAPADKHNHKDDHAHDEHAPKDAEHPDEAKDAKAEPADAKPKAEDAAHEHEHAEHEHGHDHDHGHHHEPLPESQREVTAVLLLTASIPGAPPELIAGDLIKKINKGDAGQAVLPIREISMMFQLFVDPIQYLLLGLTILIVVVAAIGILVSIYNSMSERQHEIAVMRALGAGRQTVMLIVLLESILLSLFGGVAGWILGHLVIGALDPWLTQNTGVGIGFFRFVPLELVIIPGLIALASIVGYLPALVAYRTDVAKALSASP
jgi:putative ABC transport system permease protein